MSSIPRPDLEALLQAAVAEGDAAWARRLADQMVHRRGVAALDALIEGPLAQRQGDQAVAWLRDLVFAEATPSIVATSAAPAAGAAPAPAALASLRAWLPDAAEWPQAS